MSIVNSQQVRYFLEKVKARGNRILVITEENVANCYSDFLEKIPYPYLVLPAGEGTKSRKMKAYIEDYLLHNGYLKKTELIAFGGGVISDLTGFVAATYMRGVHFSIIPTTIICYADASVGGKNGINTSLGKNLIGSFYRPVDVCREKDFFKTLPKSLYREQFSEVVKIALTCGRELFYSMENSIERAREIKESIVEKDEREKGMRKILNFGHTFAHAYERIMNYEVSHGEAVWKGIYFASLLSFRLGLLAENEWAVIKKKHPQSYTGIDRMKLYNAMLLDKKNVNATPSFILLTAIGKVYQKDGKVAHEVAKEIVLDTLEELKRGGLCTV